MIVTKLTEFIILKLHFLHDQTPTFAKLLAEEPDSTFEWQDIPRSHQCDQKSHGILANFHPLIPKRCPFDIHLKSKNPIQNFPSSFSIQNQGLVNVPIEHHPSIGDIISNRYWFRWCETNPQKGTFTNPSKKIPSKIVHPKFSIQNFPIQKMDPLFFWGVQPTATRTTSRTPGLSSGWL